MNYCKRNLNEDDKKLLEKLADKYQEDLKVLNLIRRYAFEIELDGTLLVNYDIDVTKFPKDSEETLTDFEKILLYDLEYTYDDEDLKTLINRYRDERKRDSILETQYKISIRRCDYCGEPMAEGYVLGDYEHACSYGCGMKLYSLSAEEAKAQFDEDLEDAEEPSGETYWTEWEDYFVEW